VRWWWDREWTIRIELEAVQVGLTLPSEGRGGCVAVLAFERRPGAPAMAAFREPSRPEKGFELNPWLWIGVGGYLLWGRMSLDWLITGNRELGPITLEVRKSDVPYVAEAFVTAFFGATIVLVLVKTGFWRRWIFWRA
jgi:hypothetical protein